MNRKGTVAMVNQTRGMIAVATEDDHFTIVELLQEWVVEVGDSVMWANGYGLGNEENGYGLGNEEYVNLSNGSRSRVFVQNHSVSEDQIAEQLRM